MPLRNHLNQIKNKLEDINRQHNILPFGQGSQQQQQPSQHQQYFGTTQPNQGQHPYQPQGAAGYPPPQAQNQYFTGPAPPQPQWQNNAAYQHQQPPPPPSWQDNPQHTASYSRPPAAPPVPSSSHPNVQSPVQHSTSSVYWHARFDPSIPITQEWEQKQGNNNGWGNAELEHYTSNPENNFYTHDGKMIIRAVANNSAPIPEHKYTSARLVSRQTLSRNKGALTSWLSLPCAHGIWPAFWLLPREPFTWPHDGEIDIAESWNADCKNHSCLHWGFYTPEDWSKHLVRETHLPDMPRRPIRFDFIWDCPSGGAGGRLMWVIDGRPVMKNVMPPGTRPIHDWCVILNIAIGGNVCQGKVPTDGAYDMIVHQLSMSGEPEGGWTRFDQDWHRCPDGAQM